MKQLARRGFYQVLACSKQLIPKYYSPALGLQKLNKRNFAEEKHINQEDQVDENASASQDKTLVTNELLCKLIGCKNYQINTEIRIDPYSIVKCFNENDQYLGERILKEVIEEAQEINKDVVLRNDKVKPPLVKIMKYRVELMKRLIKKLTKGTASDINVTESKSEKFIAIPLRIEENDLISKINICIELLKDFSHLQIGIYCNIYNKEEVYKATNILQHIADELLFYGKITKQAQKKKYDTDKNNYVNVIDGETESSQPENDKTATQKIVEQETKYMSSEQKEEELIDNLDYGKKLKEAANLSEGKIVNKDMVSLEIESLILDTSGINYDKLLESKNIEDIINGIKNNQFSNKPKGEATSSSESTQKTINDKGNVKAAEMSFDERLKQLQDELDSEKDLFKRLRTTKKMKQFVHEMTYSKYVLQVKTIIHTEYNTLKEGMKANPSSYL